MALEIIGLTVGGISLCALFSTCVECMEHVSNAKCYANDFELTLTKTLLLEARLRTWGESLNVTSPGHEHPVLQARWAACQVAVGRALCAIRDLLGDSKMLETKYGLLDTGGNVQGVSSVAIRPESLNLQAIAQALRSSAATRQQETSVWKKTTWVIKDKTKFGQLVKHLEFFINNLEKLSKYWLTEGLQHAQLQTRIDQICSSPALMLLERATQSGSEAEEDAASEEGLENTGQGSAEGSLFRSECSPGLTSNRWIGNVARDRARLLQLDLSSSETGPGTSTRIQNLWERNTVMGDARVIQASGNIQKLGDGFWD